MRPTTAPVALSGKFLLKTTAAFSAPGETIKVSMLKRPTNKAKPLPWLSVSDVALVPRQAEFRGWFLDDEKVEVRIRRQPKDTYFHQFSDSGGVHIDVCASLQQFAGQPGRWDHFKTNTSALTLELRRQPGLGRFAQSLLRRELLVIVRQVAGEPPMFLPSISSIAKKHCPSLLLLYLRAGCATVAR
jgi:hypothetical protein